MVCWQAHTQAHALSILSLGLPHLHVCCVSIISHTQEIKKGENKKGH